MGHEAVTIMNIKHGFIQNRNKITNKNLNVLQSAKSKSRILGERTKIETSIDVSVPEAKIKSYRKNIRILDANAL